MTSTSTTISDNSTGELTPPPCPWWCTSDDLNHRKEYDSALIDDPSDLSGSLECDSALIDEPSALSRFHSCSFGAGVAVVQEETNRDGVVTLASPSVSVYVETLSNFEEVAKFADDASAAADLLRRLEAAAQ